MSVYKFLDMYIHILYNRSIYIVCAFICICGYIDDLRSKLAGEAGSPAEDHVVHVGVVLLQPWETSHLAHTCRGFLLLPAHFPPCLFCSQTCWVERRLEPSSLVGWEGWKEWIPPVLLKKGRGAQFVPPGWLRRTDYCF